MEVSTSSVESGSTSSSPLIRGRYWDFVRTEGVVLLVSFAVLVLVSAVGMPAYATVMGWFGAIYLMAAAIALCVLGWVAVRSRQSVSELLAFGWLALIGAVAVGFSALYAFTFGAAGSDSPTTLVVSVQLIHSSLFYSAALIVGSVFHLWRSRRASK
jgi:lysylphosphatidylglycerol synthetase-like protein (DUF2156 family)